MQMENSRRSAPDRGRELGLKKPRLSDDPADRHRIPNGVATERERPFAPRDPRGRGAGAQRLRPIEREREEKEEPARGGGSYQELVAQYKTAIAELTFNSKPIITNLTIIAGENLHAAKGIAATICNHIIEVPSDQKLPSLYLLDSIVKNIKGDYIRYFAAKLPEVFCKVYRQVDSSIHPSMRHLFGTWKTVFPPATLQIIEKELGFSTVINSSSGATASKPESQTTQRQPHSIHVNPKYLEARQRLQQLSKAKDSSSDDSSLVGDAERYDRGAIVGNTKQWTELPSKMPNIQRPQREHLHDPVREKKGYKDVRDHDFSPELSRQSLDVGVRRVIEKVKERDAHGKPYYSTIGDGSEIPVSRRNDFDTNQAYETYRPSGSAQTDYHLPSAHQNHTNKSSRPTSKNWKNSEEEEFMWDDMNSRLTDYGDTNSTVKGGWNNDDTDRPAMLQRGKWTSEHIESSLNKFDSLSQFRKTSGDEDRPPLYRDIEEHLPQFRGQHGTNLRMKLETTADRFSVGRDESEYQPSSVWPPREPPSSVGSVDHVSSRYSGQSEGHHISRIGAFSTRPGPLPHAIPPTGDPFSGPAGIFGQGNQSLLSLSPRAQSPLSSVNIQHEKLHNSIDHDTLQSHSLPKMSEKPIQLPEQLNRAPQVPASRDSFPSLSQGYNQQSLPSLSSPPERLEISSTSTSVDQTRHHHPFLQLSQPDIARQTQASQLPVQIEKQPPLGSGPTQGHSTRYPNSSVDASGQLSTSNLLAAIMKSGLLPNNPASGILSQNVQPPLPSGPPPIQALTSPASLATPATLPFLASHGKTPAAMPPITKVVLPPLPPGPPPASSQIASTSRANNNASTSPNPLSGLLNSLLAKGIISSPAKEIPTVTSVQIPNKAPDKNISSESNASALVPPSSSTLNSFPSSVKELNISEPSAPTATTKLDNLIGFEFKPEIIREFHPLVIGDLFDDLKHQCSVCGLRFRLHEQLHNHNDWHASKKSEINSSEGVSRNWYTDKNNWTIGRMGPSCGPVAESLEELDPVQEKCEEPMVPADENQSICALCGEPFEDFYSDERDEWMYKGTVYFGSACGQGDMGGMDESTCLGLIVHAKCLPRSVENMEVDGHS